MVETFTELLDMTPEEIYQDWLDCLTSRDPLLKDTSVASFNSILAEAIASEFWIFLQLLKQKVKDSSVLTAEGEALSQIVLSILPEGRRAGTRATGIIMFSRPTAAHNDITIPAGTICAAMSDSGSLIEFQTDAPAVLEAGSTVAYAEATAISAGTAGNVSTGTVTIIRTPIVGISSCNNDAPFTGGTDQEDDEHLRQRAIYSIWVNGRATVPLVQEHIDGIAGVREAHVETLGQGDVLIVIDAEDDLIPEIDQMIYENLAAGTTACGVLGASIREGSNQCEIGDCSGAPVWIRPLQFCPTSTEISFTYQEPAGTIKNGTVTIPAMTLPGQAIQATLDESYPDATKILEIAYTGERSFDLFMGKGQYPRLWVAPELQAVDILLQLVLTSTPEVFLLENVRASLVAKLDSYMIGEDLEYADLVKYIYIDYATGRAFSGIDDVASFQLTCKGEIISGFGQKITIEDDERIEPGNVSVTQT